MFIFIPDQGENRCQSQFRIRLPLKKLNMITLQVTQFNKYQFHTSKKKLLE